MNKKTTRAKRRRWICPTCGVGALGPERPRKNATVRYCLDCSASSATLVERVAPAVEGARERAQSATAERDRRRRAAAARRRERQKNLKAEREKEHAERLAPFETELATIWAATGQGCKSPQLTMKLLRDPNSKEITWRFWLAAPRRIHLTVSHAAEPEGTRASLVLAVARLLGGNRWRNMVVKLAQDAHRIPVVDQGGAASKFEKDVQAAYACPLNRLAAI